MAKSGRGARGGQHARRRGDGREAVSERVAGGLAELIPDPEHSRAWQLLVDGAPQSHIDLGDPTRLSFSYQRRLGHVIDLAAPPGQPVNLLHLGGGGLTLARYAAATRPRSTQQAAEPDTALTELVRRELPLPAGARIRARAQDARAVLGRLPEGWADLVIADVFQAARTPAHCTSAEFLDQVRWVLRADGWYAANITDGPPLRHLRAQTATALHRFAAVALAVEPAMLRGRHFGNAILLAADEDLPVAELTRRCADDPCSARLLTGPDLTEFTAGAAVITDATAAASPPPPPGTFD